MGRASLDTINDFPGLLTYLEEELDWPINEATFEEATFDYTAAELGLKDDAVGGAIEIKQLRKLVDNQPWGVFFLNLPHKRLPQTIVRNILGRLTIKKRLASNDPSRPAFLSHDLLFITSTGAGADRRLSFAHFQDDPLGGNAATLKILGWDGDDTPRRLKLTESTLATKLHWPGNPADVVHWRQQWSEAFGRKDTGAVVRDSKAMAKALAALARRIRARATELIAAQTADGSLVKLHAAFKEALIHDLTPEGFADTYAQTIAYGLLSAAISRRSGGLTQDDVTANVAGTSPFLKEMLGTFIEAGGRKPGHANAGLDFDELGVGEVVDLLRAADMDAVLADFDRKNPDEDPVIHFYELFLKEYDAAQKVKRGVFYTPRPVVGFIVRSVDEVLRREFGLEDGLASTATWGEVIAASKGRTGAQITLPKGAKVNDPFVRILDPATGTGTFLVECVDLIHKAMVKKWKAAGKREPEIKALWNAYIPAHLLPRLTGFELMMAPYAIAHVKLGLKLADTGYTFGSDARAQIYLTNALEPAQDLDMQLAFMSEALAHEAKAANESKESRFTVVVGNPPYANFGSQNRNPWITSLLEDFKRDLNERKLNLDDDYIKFLRFAVNVYDANHVGVLGLITNNVYMDGLTHRRIREELLSRFSNIHLIDLHGSVKVFEHAGGLSDENVFDIQQGVGIAIFAGASSPSGNVSRSDLYGSRQYKFSQLSKHTAQSLESTECAPVAPAFRFKPKFEDTDGPLDTWASLRHIFRNTSSGIKTHADAVFVGASDQQVGDQIADFIAKEWKDVNLSTAPRSSNIRKALLLKRALAHASGSYVQRYDYRAFDTRKVAYLPDAIEAGDHRYDTMKHILAGSPALVFTRQISGHAFAHVFVVTNIADMCVLSTSTRECAYVSPLYLASTATETRTLPNITPAFAARVAGLTNLAYDDGVEGPKQGALGGILPKKAEQTAMFMPTRRERGEPGKSFGPRDLFDYIYAVLHSPTYRARYADYLKGDFARIPLPGSRALFEALVPLGTELVALHLLDAGALPTLKDPRIRFAGNGEARVANAPKFDAAGRVYINPSRWFETVPQIAWDFHVGGYQPAQKWLKDRAAKGGKKASPGRILTDADILHYRRIIVALTRTAELMPQIDAVVEANGGWPGAFRGMTDNVGAE